MPYSTLLHRFGDGMPGREGKFLMEVVFGFGVDGLIPVYFSAGLGLRDKAPASPPQYSGIVVVNVGIGCRDFVSILFAFLKLFDYLITDSRNYQKLEDIPYSLIFHPKIGNYLYLALAKLIIYLIVMN